MSKFSIGDKVSKSDNPDLLGTIVNVFPKSPGRQLYHVVFENGISADVLEPFLNPAVDLSDPFECLKNGYYGSNYDFSCLNTSHKVHNTNSNTISSLKASKTTFMPYQFMPLLKFLTSQNRRVLIADEVGLGKTIEAGHIMLELSARRELNNALVICPKSLCEKWSQELRNRFGFDFKIYDDLKYMIDDFHLGRMVRGIVNYEKIIKGSPKADRLFEMLQNQEGHLDFIICDEAHRLRNPSTKVHGGVKRLLENPCAALFLTATPIMINEENLFSLLNLLDENQYSDYVVFKNSLNVNAPFVRAITQLNNNVPYDQILKTLCESVVTTEYHHGKDELYQRFVIKTQSIAEKFSDVPLFKRIVTELKHGDGSPESQVKLQFALSAMSPMNNIFSRTRKSQITTNENDVNVRDTHTLIVDLEENEQVLYDKVINEYIQDDGIYFSSNGELKTNVLGLITRKRQISSSVYAMMNDDEDLSAGVDAFGRFPDAKVAELVRIIEAVKASGSRHLIVFAVFVKTLKYLAIRLQNYGFNTVQIHGEVENEERQIRLSKFKDCADFTILLSSEVGSEGIDLQFCDTIVNYDLPWNPMVVEQRIGRVDRINQKSELIHIYNLVVKDSIQVEIYQRLLDRIDIFKRSIGDLDAILDADLQNNGVRNIQEWFSQLERELYCTKMTIQQARAKVDAVEKAIVSERENLHKIDEGLTNTLTNDLYFRNEVEAIQHNNRYVTEEELYNYIKLLLDRELTTCTLDHHKSIDDAFVLHIPAGRPKTLTSFLTTYCPDEVDGDYKTMNERFKTKIRDCFDIPITFNQKVACDHDEIEYINAYHPLIIASTQFFKKEKTVPCFGFDLPRKPLELELHSSIPSHVAMALYTIGADKRMYGKTQHTELLMPILFDLDKESIIEDTVLTSRIYSYSQTSSKPSKMAVCPLSGDLALMMRSEFAKKISDLDAEYIEDQRVMLESSKSLQISQLEDFYDAQIKSLEAVVDHDRYISNYGDNEARKNASQILSAHIANLNDRINQKAERIKAINEISITGCQHVLLSICSITLN